MNIIIRQTITGTATVENFPTGREVIIQTDADLQLEFWNPSAGEFADPLSVSAPQAVVVCPSAKVRITTATTADVNVVLSNAVNADAVKTVSQALTVVQQSHARENLDLWAYTYPLICGVAPSSVEYSDGNIVRFIVRRADGTRIRIDFIYLAGDYAGSITASDTRLSGDSFEAGASLEWSVDSWYLTASEGIISAPGEYLDNPASLEWPASVESVVSQIADTGMIALFPNNPDAALWFNPALSVWTRVSPDGDDLVRLSGTQTVGGAKTFSGQVELTGQTAANPTSAMNRYLTEVESMMNVGAVKPLGPFTVSGTGASLTVNGDDTALFVNSSVNASARIVLARNLTSQSVWGGATIDCTKNFDLAFSLAASIALAGTKVRVTFGSAVAIPNADTDPLDGKGWGIEFTRLSGSSFRARLFAYDSSLVWSAGTYDITGYGSKSMLFRKQAGTLSLWVVDLTSRIDVTAVPTLSMSGAPTTGNTATGQVTLEIANGAIAGLTSAVRLLSQPIIRIWS